ncbi:MAG: hypothetical protein FWE19_08095 [Oscillospiraceae bacterium]|nr:hypothetical protein [Oscillospiraceae bacterium]
MQKNKREGILAPTVIVAIIVAFDVIAVVAGVLIVRSFFPEYARFGTFFIIAASVLVTSAIAIYVLLARIKEIRSERKDDLSKY